MHKLEIAWQRKMTVRVLQHRFEWEFHCLVQEMEYKPLCSLLYHRHDYLEFWNLKLIDVGLVNKRNLIGDKTYLIGKKRVKTFVITTDSSVALRSFLDKIFGRRSVIVPPIGPVSI